jgi:hypothetical protein
MAGDASAHKIAASAVRLIQASGPGGRSFPRCPRPGRFFVCLISAIPARYSERLRSRPDFGRRPGMRLASATLLFEDQRTHISSATAFTSPLTRRHKVSEEADLAPTGS